MAEAAPTGLTPAAGISAGLDLLSGLFGYFASQQTAQIAESRGRMLQMDAEADAQRYAEQADHLTASQGVAYLKSGVKLSGSPLDVIAKDVLTAQENISAIRARGAAGQLDQQNEAAQLRMGGRNALIGGITSGVGKLAWAQYQGTKNKELAATNRKDLTGGPKTVGY